MVANMISPNLARLYRPRLKRRLPGERHLELVEKFA
jgi:hypothetical protein